MRNLVITRNKSFVACLNAMKVYIEDATAPDLTISGIPCRLLGKIKNGEQKVFSIDEEARRVFVIPGQMSKSITCDSYPLPAGTTDVYLTGKNHYNPVAGNPFYFDGNTDPAALASRKKGSRTGLIIMIGAVILGLVVGFLLTWKPAPKEKVFTCEDMQITLNESFGETEYMGYKTVYRSKNAVILVLKDNISELPSEFKTMTTEEYGEFIIELNQYSESSTVEQKDGLIYFEYEATSDGEDFYYFSTIYRTEDAFWVIQFSTKQEDADKMQDDFIEWAKSVSFEA